MPEVLSITCDAKQFDAEIQAIDAKVKELGESARQAGGQAAQGFGTAGEAAAAAGKEIANVPSEKSITVTSNAADAAQKVKQALNNIPAKKTVTVTVKADTGAVKALKTELDSAGKAGGGFKEQLAKGWSEIRAELNNTAGGAKKLVSSFLAGGGAIGIIVAGVAALGKIIAHVAGAGVRAMQRLSEMFQNNAKSIRETAEAHEQARQKSDQYINRLGELAKAEKLSNADKAEALKLIGQLNKGYADLGITIDKTTGKITGLDAAMAKKLQRDKENALAEIDIELRQLDADDKVQEGLINSAGVNVGFGIQLGGQEQASKATAAIEANAKRRMELIKKQAALRGVDPAEAYRAQRKAENADLEQGLTDRRKAFDLRQRDEEFSRLTDPAARIANRQRLIDQQKPELDALQEKVNAAHVSMLNASGDDKLEAEKKYLQLLNEQQTQLEKLHGWEQQIADIKREQTKAYNDIRQQGAYEIAAGKLAASGEYEKLEALKLEQELRQKNLALTQDQKDAILAQRAALRGQALDANLRDQAEGLMGQVAERTGRGKEFAVEKALRDAKKLNGGELDEEKSQLVRKLAELSYGMSHGSNMPQLGDLSIRTNSLTARGGFAGGAAAPNSNDINLRIANYNKQQVDSLKEIEQICSKLGTIN